MARVRLLERTPLRVKLIVAVLALVTVTLTLIGLASTTALRGYLVERLDDELAMVARQFAHGPPGRGPSREGERPPPSPYLVQRRDASGAIEDTPGNNLLEQGHGQPRLPDDGDWFRDHAGTPLTVPATEGEGRWRVLVQPRQDDPSDSVVVAASLDGIGATVARLQFIDLTASLAVLAVLAGVGVAIVRASLRPLVEMEHTAEAIAAGDLTRRVPDRDPRTEVGRLAAALNSMLAQIEAAFRARAASEATARRSEERMRRFVADASHELRTPLTTIRGFAELYRQGATRDAGELDRLMRRIEDQAARMGLLVEDLLLLARLDQQRPLDRRPVDLLALAAEAVNDARAIAPDRPIELQLGNGDGGTAGGPLVVLGDEDRLRQVIANLMSNALTHTPAGSPIELRAGSRRDDGRSHAAIEVVDHGPGLTQEQTERVFERFYRADQARTRAHGGTGLGLSIVAALVAAHGGTVEVRSVPGQGASFRVLLPLDPGTPAG
jgi:two-component system OmpR family sensor kinase